MNWVIKNSEKLRCHTDLKEILFPIITNIESYNWLLCDLEFISNKELPINHDEDYFILSNKEFKELLDSETQLIWGVVIGFQFDKEIIIDQNELPFADGNDLAWMNDHFQAANSLIEIIAFDSSCTIVKFKDQKLSDNFKNYFEEAFFLSEFDS
ncbi:hypothetical protein [Flavobacterium hungaricum]|uniref:Uncharacterized protein n=1 Tax=Flavobacterium hungaricum TaxID=2082725 RepID=A0ABR9TK26_9FLAO|nr:hypothetical protein [Flavobacterium hungaricum]MBE8725711.1 hypothetical protein [Flavobacterium hungaricum]